jgi:RHS repeat-associated protein
MYDATGGKLRKQVIENEVAVPWGTGTLTSNITTTTIYADGFIYETKLYSQGILDGALGYTLRLQYILHEEGRIRMVHGSTPAQNKLAYDYHLTDHVGNIRTVLTEEALPPTDFKATMETANRTQEEGWFEGIGHSEHNKPTGFDANGSNAKVSRLFNASGNDKRVGPAIMLKVMSGDKFTAQVRGWYLPNGTDDALLPDAVPVLQQVVDAFGAALPTGSKIGAAQAGLAGGAISSFITTQQSAPPSGRPKAYLNWMLLDEQGLALDASVRGARLVPAITGTMPAQLIQANGGSEIPITRNGYLFVFVSNESQGNVYFDDLSVVYTPGPLLEEHHFYPTGLEIFALSSTAGNGHVRNKYGYQGQEHERHFALHLNEFEARHYDPQSARWMVPDPANQFASSFVGMGNAWVNSVDPDGRIAFAAVAPFLIAAAKGAAIASATYVAGNFVNGNSWNDLNFKGWATSAALGAIGGAFAHGVGNAFMGAKPGLLTELGKASVHGQFNAIMSGVMGGDPLAGFAAGFGGSMVGAYTDEWGKVSRLGVSMAVGGGASVLAGGDFMKGATTAGIGFLTNQLPHELIEMRKNIANTALKYNGSTRWAEAVENGNFPEGSYKCNQFVYDVTTEAGASPGLPNGIFKRYPPTAGDWGNPNVKIKGWRVVKTPIKGDVASIPLPPGSGATGHVGVVFNPGSTVSAGTNQVTWSDWGFRPNQVPVFRRWVGP